MIMINSNKKLAVLLLFLAFANIAIAQTTNWNWLTQTESTDSEICLGAVRDAQGNVYHAGSFSGSFNIEGTTVQSWGGPLAANCYVSRFNPVGPSANNWTFVVGTKGNNTPQSNVRGLSVDAAGNSLFWYAELNVSFSLPDTIQIGPNNFWLKTSNLPIISILIKLDPQGNLLWFKPFDAITGVVTPIVAATNAQGDHYIAGKGGPISLDSTLQTTGNSFIAKLDANGNYLWAQSLNSEGSNFKVIVNQQDEVFVSGVWDTDTLTLDTFSLINPNQGSPDNRYITKLNSSGQVQWLMSEAGQGTEYAASLAPKASGGIMCLSILDTSANLLLDNGTISISPPGIILTQYDAQGNFESYTQYPINSQINIGSRFSGCVIGGDGNDFFMSAKYNEPSLSLNGTTLNNAGASAGTFDAVLAKIDTTGAILWLANIGEEEDEEIVSLNYSANYGLTMAGNTSSSQLIFGNDTVINGGFLRAEAFVANLSYSGIGLNELKNVETISLYPNPTSGQLFFNLEETESERITLKVENLIGQVVLEKRLDPENAEQILDVQQLNPGLYLINIADGTKTFSGKFIKK
jgi:hypothetical protein